MCTERSQAELKTNLSKVGDESESIARAHEQVRELLEEKDEGLTAFKEMEAAALRLQEDIIKRCAERDNLLERMSELEATVAEMNTRNEELEKMLYEHITKDMTHKKFVKEVGAGRGPVSDVLSKLKRGSAGVGDASGKVREGWMLKKGAMNTEWKRRWFVLSAQERRLVYYKSDTAKKAQGSVSVFHHARARARARPPCHAVLRFSAPVLCAMYDAVLHRAAPSARVSCRQRPRRWHAQNAANT